MPAFTLDARLVAASHLLTDLPLCQARLHDDSRWPWLVLVPRRGGLTELDALAPGDRAELIEEIARASAAVRALGGALDWPVLKINVGALGNVTPQLHVHVVGRRPGDAAWPGPVWGAGVAQPYLSQVENGSREPSHRVLEKLSLALNVPVGHLAPAPKS